MNAIELADELDGYEPLGGREFIAKVSTMLRQQEKEIEQLKANLNIEKECYDKIKKHNLYLEYKHKHLRDIVIEINEEIKQLKKQINLLVVSREQVWGLNE